MRLTVWIDEQHSPTLRALAIREKRLPAKQAAVLIERALADVAPQKERTAP